MSLNKDGAAAEGGGSNFDTDYVSLNAICDLDGSKDDLSKLDSPASEYGRYVYFLPWEINSA